MSDISINFCDLGGNEYRLSFPNNFIFNDLNWDDNSYVSLFYIGDLLINKHDLLFKYSDQTIHVIKKKKRYIITMD